MLPRINKKGIFNFTFRVFILILILLGLPVSPVFADGEAGSAMSFDGVDDYVFLGETNMIMGGTSWQNTKTVSLWIKPEGSAMVCSPDPTRCDAVFGDRPRWWGISRGVINGEDRIWVWNYDGNTDYVGVRYSENEWLQITLVHQAGVLSAYKNGQLVGSVTSGTTVQPITGGLPNLQVGGVIVGTTNYWAFEGDIDEVRIYNTALSQTEIQNTLFNELLGNESGLVAYYPANVLQSGKLPDQRVDALGDPVSDPHDGTLFGGTIPPSPFLTASSAFDKPLAMDQTLTTNEDTNKSITLFGIDKQNDPLTFTVTENPTHGVLSGSGQNLTYIPNTNYFGTDHFTYTVNDLNHTSAAGIIFITVNPVNDPPVADDIDLSTPINTAVPVVLTGSDIEGGMLNFHVSSLPSHGLISGTPPNLTYTPSSGFVGSDSFTFDVFDQLNASDRGTVTIQVVSVNLPPVVNNQSLSTNEDTPLPITLTASDAEGDPYYFTIATQPLKGTLSGTLPNLVYTPGLNQNGSDSFTVFASDAYNSGPITTISINITAVNDAPIAYNQSLQTDEDFPLFMVLTGSDVDGNTLNYSIITPPGHGSLSGTAPNLTYTPNLNFNGADQFTFRVSDGLLNSALATISIGVNPVNDAPTANAQSVTTNEDSQKTIILSGSDVDGDGITYQIVNLPGFGGISGTPPNLIYTPNSNYFGQDQFTFRTNDGLLNSTIATITITVNPVNDPPTANSAEVILNEDTLANFTLSGGDIDGDVISFVINDLPDHGQVSGTIPNLTYTPDVNFSGIDSLTFHTDDGPLNSATATITFTVNAINDAPQANSLTVVTNEDTQVNIVLSGSDIDGDPISYVNISQPAHGVLSGTAPNLVYTPQANYQGSDQFSFRVFDGVLYSITATVSITVTAVNDPPVADAQSLVTEEDTSLGLTLTGSDSEGALLNFNFQQPIHGVLSGTAPNLTYTPAVNFNGVDHFTFTVNDGAVDSAPATVEITVNAVNDQPAASAQTLTTEEDIPLPITLTGSDVDGDGLTFAVLTDPNHGTLSGTIPNLTYTPDLNFYGADRFTFLVNDGVMNSVEATISITVNAVNDLPLAEGQSLITDEDTELAVVLTGSDVDGDSLSLIITDGPTYGVLTGTGLNRSYVPDPNFNGNDQFSFVVNDGFANSAPATVTITINAVADVPIGFADDYEMVQDQVLSVDSLNGVLNNDLDGDGDSLTAEMVSNVTSGTLILNADGSFEYTPNPGFVGDDYFIYKVSDGVLYSEEIMVTIHVLPEIPVTSGYEIFLPLIKK